MGQKSAQSTSAGDVRAKAQAMRMEQQRADARVRNIIIAVVVVFVLAISAAVAWVVATAKELEAPTTGAEAAAVLGDYADGKPIVMSHKGFGQLDDTLPTLTENFDYSCPACTVAAVSFDDALFQGMQDGKYNLEFRPVMTHNAPWNAAATTASLVVANKAPEKWVDFHEALMTYAYAESAAQRGTTVNNLSASGAQVKLLAQEVGIAQEIVDSFPVNAVDAYLEKTSTEWGAQTVEGRNGLGTPEFVATIDGKSTKIDLQNFEPADALAKINAGLGLKK